MQQTNSPLVVDQQTIFMNLEKIKSLLFGVAVGDALGVPLEFQTRVHLVSNPVTDMQEYGTHNQPKGTWSDDSSLTFCMVEALCNGYDTEQIANNFVKWYKDAWWTAHNEVFDVGIATRNAIYQLNNGVNATEAGGENEGDNGNGSLMRIAPLVFHIQHLPIEERFRITCEVSSITHRHIRSILACFYYLEFLRHILLGNSKEQAFNLTSRGFKDFCKVHKIPKKELTYFDRLCNLYFPTISKVDIQSSGYVIHTLEAAIWCLMNNDNYAETVLIAVNLGNDTDTTAAVAGGLAGLLCGFENIPSEWVGLLARKNDILDLAERYWEKICNLNNNSTI
jgi:ADP-ribosyl-[dinitrogen reductase] hydrolase